MDLEEWLDVGTLSTGRRLFVLALMKEAAQAMGGHEDFVERIDEAAAHEEQTRELEDRWGGVRSGNFDAVGVGPLDRTVDRAISAVRDGAELQRQGAEPDDPIHGTVDGFLKVAFPEGVFAITSLPHVDQLSKTEKLLSKLQGPLAGQVTELGLGRQVTRIELLLPKYRAALQGSGELALAFAPVREVRRRSHRYMLELVAMVLGRYNRADEPAHRAAREQLLSPLWKQLQASRVLRGRRTGNGPEVGADAGPEPGADGPGLPAGTELGQPGQPVAENPAPAAT
jgi:hypothetical protein